jgi:PhzF family phenazine biosynthesis protein
MSAEIVYAFVKDNQGGNPAGVVLEADALSSDQKQDIAAKLGLSETAFVSKADGADFLLEFFTPNRQIPHCGHATIATFGYMQSKNLLAKETYRMKTIAGANDVFVKGEMIFMEQRAPQYVPVKDEKAVFASLGISSADGDIPLVVNTGNSFLLLEVNNSSILKNIQYNPALVEAISEQYDLIGFYVFTRDSKNADATARMFGPRYSIPEEAGTGMAAGPLACYLYDYRQIKKSNFLIEQGAFMVPPSPSELVAELKLKDGRIDSLLVGGKALARS